MISQMFLRIKIREADRGAQRFLWRGKDREQEVEEFEMKSLIFGALSALSTAICI